MNKKKNDIAVRRWRPSVYTVYFARIIIIIILIIRIHYNTRSVQEHIFGLIFFSCNINYALTTPVDVLKVHAYTVAHQTTCTTIRVHTRKLLHSLNIYICILILWSVTAFYINNTTVASRWFTYTWHHHFIKIWSS